MDREFIFNRPTKQRHSHHGPLLLEHVVGAVAQQPLQLLLAHAVGRGGGRGRGGGARLDGLEDGVVEAELQGGDVEHVL